jgi:hypothetical protein
MSLNERNKLAELEPAVSGDQGALAELALAVGQHTKQSHGPARPRIEWASCHPVEPQAALSGSGTFDAADLLGPHDPYWWDLRLFAAWGFTAGTVTIYKNATAGQQIGALSAPGNITWSSQKLLRPRDRIIVVAAGITGNVQFSLEAIEVESRWLPEYLM